MAAGKSRQAETPESLRDGARQTLDSLSQSVRVLEEQLMGKAREIDKIVRLTNRYKEQLTQADLKIVDLEIQVETLQKIVQAQARQLEQTSGEELSDVEPVGPELLGESDG